MLQFITQPDKQRRSGALAEASEHGDGIYAMFVADGVSENIRGFDRHVVACILTMGYTEAASSGLKFSDTTGLDEVGLERLLGNPRDLAATWPTALAAGPLLRGPDEVCLLDLLTECANRSPLSPLLAAMIARRAQGPNHLWQDLGLRNRDELSELMQRHFRALAMRNGSDMKWKKFLYRMICRDAGYSICTAPSCSECSDFEHCFGDESGESLLARVRRATERDSVAQEI